MYFVLYLLLSLLLGLLLYKEGQKKAYDSICKNYVVLEKTAIIRAATQKGEKNETNKPVRHGKKTSK